MLHIIETFVQESLLWLHASKVVSAELLSVRCIAGGLSGKGKVPYAILALMDVIRHHPGQVRPRASFT